MRKTYSSCTQWTEIRLLKTRFIGVLPPKPLAQNRNKKQHKSGKRQQSTIKRRQNTTAEKPTDNFRHRTRIAWQVDIELKNIRSIKQRTNTTQGSLERRNSFFYFGVRGFLQKFGRTSPLPDIGACPGCGKENSVLEQQQQSRINLFVHLWRNETG